MNGNSFTILFIAVISRFILKEFRFPERAKSKEDWVMWVCIYKSNCKTVFDDETLVLQKKSY
jgi:hypothetical protein